MDDTAIISLTAHEIISNILISLKPSHHDDVVIASGAIFHPDNIANLKLIKILMLCYRGIFAKDIIR